MLDVVPCIVKAHVVMTPIQVYGLYRYTRPMITYGGIQTPRICSVIGENELRAILCKWCTAQKHHAAFRNSMSAARSIMNRLFVGVLCCVVLCCVCLFVLTTPSMPVVDLLPQGSGMTLPGHPEYMHQSYS